MEKWLKNVLPVMAVENDCILSKMGDITVVYECTLPGLFTLSDQEYEAFHQAWVKAIKILPGEPVLWETLVLCNSKERRKNRENFTYGF